MNLRKLTLASLLLAIGVVLHYTVPGLSIGAMKIDPSLALMFTAILLCEDYKSTVIIGLASGFLTALTTTFPAGQIPNIVDKIVTSHIVYLMIKVSKNKINEQIMMVIVAAIGTMISGVVFLGSALFLFKLPAPFSVLFTTVVIPAVVVNIILVLVVNNVVSVAFKRISYKLN